MIETINDIISFAVGAWYRVPLGMLILGLTFGFVPGLVLNLGVLLYPKDHPRRKELVAEMHKIAYFRRAFWVFYALQLAVTEGIPARWRLASSVRQRRRDDKRVATIVKLGMAVTEKTEERHIFVQWHKNPLRLYIYTSLSWSQRRRLRKYGYSIDDLMELVVQKAREEWDRRHEEKWGRRHAPDLFE